IRDLRAGSYALAFDGPDGARERLPAVVANPGAAATVLSSPPFALAPLELQRGLRLASGATTAIAVADTYTGLAAVLTDAVAPVQPLKGFAWTPLPSQWSYPRDFQFTVRDGAERMLFVALDRNRGQYSLYEANLETGVATLAASGVYGNGERYVASGTAALY